MTKKIFFCEWVPTATVAEGKEGEQEERFWSLAPRFFFLQTLASVLYHGLFTDIMNHQSLYKLWKGIYPYAGLIPVPQIPKRAKANCFSYAHKQSHLTITN